MILPSRLLGRGEVRVTRLGLGLAPIAGLYSSVPVEQAIATIDRAWELGVRLFDTAPLYGYGESERRAGMALRKRPRDEYVLCTKVGRLLVKGGEGGQDIWADLTTDVAPTFDFSRDGVRRSLRDSVARLGIDRIDVVHLHDPEDHYPQAVGEAHETLAELKADGEIAAVSVGTNRADFASRYVRDAEFDAIMLAGRYTLLDQSALREALPVCLERGTSVLAAGVFNSGILADPHGAQTFDYHPASPELIERALTIDEVCSRHGVPLRAAAIQFPLAHPAVAAVVVGARSPEEVEDAVNSFHVDIPSGLWAELKGGGLLSREAPTPES